MKTLLVFASIVAATYAGVGVLDAGRAAEAARLWKKYCSGSSDAGIEGSTYIYCKIGSPGTDQNFDHSVTIRPAPDSGDQVIFIKPPSKKYNHRVVITGEQGGKQQATIYVLPQKDEHKVEIVDQTETGDGAPQKPHLFFLDESPDGSGRTTGPRKQHRSQQS